MPYAVSLPALLPVPVGDLLHTVYCVRVAARGLLDVPLTCMHAYMQGMRLGSLGAEASRPCGLAGLVLAPDRSWPVALLSVKLASTPY